MVGPMLCWSCSVHSGHFDGESRGEREHFATSHCWISCLPPSCLSELLICNNLGSSCLCNPKDPQFDHLCTAVSYPHCFLTLPFTPSLFNRGTVAKREGKLDRANKETRDKLLFVTLRPPQTLQVTAAKVEIKDWLCILTY